MPNIFDAQDSSRDRRFADDTTSLQEGDQPISPEEKENSQTPVYPPKQRTPKRMHIFTSFCEKPEAVTFQTQDNDETILLLIRRSFITNTPWIFFGILFALVPPLVFTFIPFINTPFTTLPGAYIFVLISLYYLVIASYLFVNFITWYFNTTLITTKRIMDIDFQDLVYKNIAETKMDLVQDVSETETGVLRNVFNFGNVLVQTAGTLENFNLEAVPHPDRAVEIVEELIGKGRGTGV